MAARHRRSWSAIDGGRVQFESGYWASVVKLESDRSIGILLTIVDLLTGAFDEFGSAPRYRVLIGRQGTQSTIGIREARTEAKARRELAGIAATMSKASADEAKAAFGLDF